MRNRGGEFNVTHSVAAHDRARKFYPALLADDALVAHPAVLAAVALVVAVGSEDALVKETTLFAALSAVVDGLGLRYFSERPLLDIVGRGEPQEK